MKIPVPLSTALRAGADACVKCGLCLPHCPTYRLTGDEGESPRGRIALMQGLAEGWVEPSPALQGHLDRCLTCRACEAVCPAQVQYGALIDTGRRVLAGARPLRTAVMRIAAAFLTVRPLRALAALLLAGYRRSGVQGLIRRFHLLGRGRLARLESLLPAVHLPRLPSPRAPAASERVALFAGCTSPLVEPATLDAAATLLAALDCGVDVPQDQGCCGALHQHAGLHDPAAACIERNAVAFAGASAVIGVASGCTAQLREAGAAGGAAGAGLARKAFDAAAFIAGHPRTDRLRFRPLAARVLLQTPCTLRNVVKQADATRALLARIPQLEIVEMGAACCGAAGSYFLTQPAMADALLEPKVTQAAALQPAFVLSSNVGCAMHLAAGLRRAGVTAPVWHPLRLLAQQWDGSGPLPAAAAAARPARPA